MTSALSILRAFAETVAGTDDWTNWSMEARAALEAAAKAPLSNLPGDIEPWDTEWQSRREIERGKFFAWIVAENHRAGNWPQRAITATLDALDAYQRGGK